MSEITITTANFDKEILQADKPALVDFWAPWCGPCRMLGPIVAQIAEENEGKAIVGKVNIDENEALAARFGISAIPTLIAFKNGAEVGRAVGLQGKAALEQMIK